MARTISITTPAEVTDKLLEDLGRVDELLELQVFRSVSVQPPGDVVNLAVPNRRLNEVMRLLDGYGLGNKDGISLSTSEVESYIPTGPRNRIERDNNEGTWEEMEMTVSDDSNSTPNTLLLMFLAGCLATIGVATASLHIIIAGMLVAPGFMPILRVALVWVGRRNTWQYGAADFCRGYLSLIIGAGISSVVMTTIGYPPLSSSSSYYSVNQPFIDYWSSVTAPSLLASVAAAAAGALLVATKRSVFTSGVMIGLALVPSAAIVGMGLVAFEFDLVAGALARFALDAAIVFVISFTVLLCDRHILHKRDIKL